MDDLGITVVGVTPQVDVTFTVGKADEVYPCETDVLHEMESLGREHKNHVHPEIFVDGQAVLVTVNGVQAFRAFLQDSIFDMNMLPEIFSGSEIAKIGDVTTANHDETLGGRVSVRLNSYDCYLAKILSVVRDAIASLDATKYQEPKDLEA